MRVTPSILRLLRTSAATLMICAMSVVHADTAHYHITAEQPVPGGTHWDYLAYEPSRHQLFIAHGDHVDVVDTRSQTLAGTIPDTQGVHGIALIPQLDRGYTSNGLTNNVTQFRLSDLRVLGQVATDSKPDAIVYDSASLAVFTANGKGRSLTRIDPNTNRSQGSIALDASPEFTVSDGAGHLFVNAEDRNELIKVDSHSGKILTRFNLAPQCESPTGLAIDRAQQRLFTACQNNVLLVIDAASGAIMQALPIDGKNDAVVFDDAHKRIFSSNGVGTLTVIGAINASRYEVQQVVTTLPGARTMALDPDSGRLYLVAADKPQQNGAAANAGLTLLTISP